MHPNNSLQIIYWSQLAAANLNSKYSVARQETKQARVQNTSVATCWNFVRKMSERWEVMWEHEVGCLELSEDVFIHGV